MATTWANPGGLDLHVVVDRAGRRVAASLEAALREAVRGGRLRPGTTLPPTRSLAADLGVARNTVAGVYGRLIDEGWLVARQGSATRVADGPHLAVDVDLPATAPGPAAPEYDLRAGFPDPTSFPAAAWTAVTRRVLTARPDTASGYGPDAGSQDLRETLTRYLGRARGVATRPDRLIVTAGFSGALRTLAAMLRARGVRAVGVEAYGHVAHRQALRDAGLDVVLLDVDADGAVAEGLDGVGAVVLTSAHQFPLGMALSADRRAGFVRWARAQDAVIVEDDYDGEFRYDRRAVGAMQPHAPEHVVYAGTASKTLAPGLALGWLAVPSRLVDPVVATQQAQGGRPAPLLQAILAQLIESGDFDRHVRRMRAHYRGRRSDLVTAVGVRRNRAVTGSITGLDAGLHAVLELPAATNEDDAVERCRRRGVAVEGLRSFTEPGVEDDRRPAVVVGYGTPPAADYARALRRLRAALADR